MTQDQLEKLLVCANKVGIYNKAILGLAAEMQANKDQGAPKIREGCEDIMNGLTKIHNALAEKIPGFKKL
ncbi:MAG TPA: hypothetical protein PKI55_06340 [Chitinophagaceae bacterium]|nr:hypothetical protein [Chitinophagaceae bacterium]